MKKTVTFFLVVFVFVTSNISYAGRFSNCMKCHNPSKIFKSNKEAIKMFTSGGTAQALKQSLKVATDENQFLLREIPKEELLNKPNLFAVVPDDDKSYRKVYEMGDDEPIDPRELENLGENKVMLASIYRQKTHFAKNGGKKELINFINKNKNKNLVLLGHNENGTFRLPSGEGVPLVDIEKQCKVKLKNCVFISCESKKWVKSNLSVNPSISYDEATEIALKVDAVVTKLGGNKVNKDELVEYMDAIVLDARNNTKKEVIKSGTLPGMVIIGVVAAYNEVNQN